MCRVNKTSASERYEGEEMSLLANLKNTNPERFKRSVIMFSNHLSACFYKANLTVTIHNIHFAETLYSPSLTCISSPPKAKKTCLIHILFFSFYRLRHRFLTCGSFGGPCPPPTFHGCQEFYRDFIVIANNATFNQHLTNAMVAKLKEVSGMKERLMKNI